MGGATIPGDMNTANVDDDEEYVPSNDEGDSDSAYIETGMGEGTGKPKRKASNQKATSRASAKRAKKKQLPEKRYLFFLPRIFLFSKFFSFRVECG